jgi:hypothetical protein
VQSAIIDGLSLQPTLVHVEGDWMKRLFLILVALLLPALIRADEPVQVPKGIRYAAAPDEVNDAARQALRERFKADATDEDVRALFEDMLFCGPALWRNLKDDEDLSKVKGNKLNLKIPVLKRDGTHDRFDTMEGRIFRNEQVLIFWKALVKQADFNDLKVRKLNPQELAIFWKMIPFDISEPIFIMESNKHKFLVLFLGPTPKKPDRPLKIMWMDDFRSFFIKEEANRTADADK